MNNKIKHFEKTKEYKTLYRSIIENLESRGMVEEVYMDKAKEYMDFWVQRKQLEKDIAQRGVTVEDKKRGMNIENRSVSLAVQVSRQMLAIYTALGLKEEAERTGGEDDEL